MHWIALKLQPDLTAELANAATALGWWALQFTPKVAWVDGALVLELSASERLFGGRAALVQRIRKENRPPAPVNSAQGATSLIAVAKLHPLGRRVQKPDDLPLAALAPARPHLATLETIGCTRWGQLRALPRGGVARRFGAELVDALDRAYGQQPEVYPWLLLPEVFEARLELAARVDNAPALMFGARRLLGQLQLWLQLRQRGILALELGWELDTVRRAAPAGPAPVLVIRTAEATLDLGHLQRLLSEHLARVTLPAPVEALTLRSLETAALGGASASLLPDEVLHGDSWHQLLERLSARLGPQAVLHAVPRADHRPECMQAWQASVSNTQGTTKTIAVRARSTGAGWQMGHATDALYPTWLLAAPLRLEVLHELPQYQGELALLAGPQRVETGWWAGASAGAGAVRSVAMRDYFIARSPQAQLLWIYRERLPRQSDASWYLHGLFA
jgi:protein ImuB